jgi:hypothetical protein
MASYLKAISKSKDFDDSFRKAVMEHQKVMVKKALITARQFKTDPDEILQYLVIRLWEDMGGFYDKNVLVDGVVCRKLGETPEGVYVQHHKIKSIVPKDQVFPATWKIYVAFFYRRIGQMCADYAAYCNREKRGSKVDIYSLDTSSCSDDDDGYTLMDVTQGDKGDPESILICEEIREKLYQRLSNKAKRYLDMIEYLPPGPLEGWSKPSKLYMKELRHAEAEVHRVFNKVMFSDVDNDQKELMVGLGGRSPVFFNTDTVLR